MKLNFRICVWGIAALVIGSAAGLGLRAEIHAVRPSVRSDEMLSSNNATDGTNADRIALGKKIFHSTPEEAKAYVGNRLSCNSCHFRDGTAPHASPMIDVAETFPQFSERAKRTITLKDRIQECFVRSENGHPLPENGKEMMALAAYIDSLSAKSPEGKEYSGRGLVKVPDLKGNPQRGEKIYVSQCAVCHGFAGEGVGPMLPPVWGDGSFNDGAGMHKVEKMAAFVVKNMPQTKPGSLTAQEAFDVSAFIHSKPRPKFNPQYAKY
jgi:thiosulfate dehydrogenase